MFGISRLEIYGILIAIGLALGGIGYFTWKSSVEAAATAAYNTKQLEQVVEDQRSQMITLQVIQGLQKDISKDLKDKKEAIDQTVDAIVESLGEPDVAKTDRESSLVLKKAIERLKEIK